MKSLRAAGLDMWRVSAKDGGRDDSLSQGEVAGADLPSYEMAALRQTLTQQSLPTDAPTRRALMRALIVLGAGGAQFSLGETDWTISDDKEVISIEGIGEITKGDRVLLKSGRAGRVTGFTKEGVLETFALDDEEYMPAPASEK